MLNHGSDVGAHCLFLSSGCGVGSAVQPEFVPLLKERQKEKMVMWKKH